MKISDNEENVKFAFMALKTDSLEFKDDKNNSVFISVQNIDTASRYKKGSKPQNLKLDIISDVKIDKS